MNKEILSDLPEKEILRQATRGLQYLHENNFVHRNIKPNNFLIKKLDSSVNSACRYVVKITDFRLTRRHDPENDIKLSGSAASEGWEAPESGDKTKDLSTKLDVFILGCFYHYVLTARTGNNEPKHPFGNHGVRRDNIRDTTYFVYQKNHELVLSDQNKNVVKLIKSMLKFNEGERPELEEVLRSPYYNPSEDYKIGDKKYKKPGLCVIFNQQVFHDKTQNRGGSDKDRDKLEKTFKKLGFKIEIIENSASFDLKSDIKDLAKRDWKDYGCLVVCFLSHGIENEIMCYDGLYVNINELKYEFSLAKCPNLYGKPKIFIVQACQGELSQSETDIVYPSRNSSHAATKLLSHICDTVLFALGKWQSPSIAQSPRMEVNTNRESETPQKLTKYPPLMDFITIKATLAGFEANRLYKNGKVREYLGSSFIQALCEALWEAYLNEKPSYADLESVVKCAQDKVNEKLENVEPKQRQTLESIVSLKKYIRFRKCKTEDIAHETSKIDRKDEYHFIQMPAFLKDGGSV
ncbi:uncharacterized protein LOC130691334 [Daphnia carinata]|uniref:uncharacterized protein LOC130691334 n=1 Tax=Daphnia carinata TaxID=120202 RepID=UPI002868E906|nr:uncharacterized protein LOC130691334 [Daphnia carinata]